jgi:hypothetical protein
MTKSLKSKRDKIQENNQIGGAYYGVSDERLETMGAGAAAHDRFGTELQGVTDPGLRTRWYTQILRRMTPLHPSCVQKDTADGVLPYPPEHVHGDNLFQNFVVEGGPNSHLLGRGPIRDTTANPAPEAWPGEWDPEHMENTQVIAYHASATAGVAAILKNKWNIACTASGMAGQGLYFACDPELCFSKSQSTEGWSAAAAAGGGGAAAGGPGQGRGFENQYILQCVLTIKKSAVHYMQSRAGPGDIGPYALGVCMSAFDDRLIRQKVDEMRSGGGASQNAAAAVVPPEAAADQGPDKEPQSLQEKGFNSLYISGRGGGEVVMCEAQDIDIVGIAKCFQHGGTHRGRWWRPWEAEKVVAGVRGPGGQTVAGEWKARIGSFWNVAYLRQHQDWFMRFFIYDESLLAGRHASMVSEAGVKANLMNQNPLPDGSGGALGAPMAKPPQCDICALDLGMKPDHQVTGTSRLPLRESTSWADFGEPDSAIYYEANGTAKTRFGDAQPRCAECAYPMYGGRRPPGAPAQTLAQFGTGTYPPYNEKWSGGGALVCADPSHCFILCPDCVAGYGPKERWGPPEVAPAQTELRAIYGGHWKFWQPEYQAKYRIDGLIATAQNPNPLHTPKEGHGVRDGVRRHFTGCSADLANRTMNKAIYRLMNKKLRSGAFTEDAFQEMLMLIPPEQLTDIVVGIFQDVKGARRAGAAEGEEKREATRIWRIIRPHHQFCCLRLDVNDQMCFPEREKALFTAEAHPTVRTALEEIAGTPELDLQWMYEKEWSERFGLA